MIDENKFTLDMQSEISSFASNLQNSSQVLSTKISNIDPASFEVLPQNESFQATVFSDPIAENRNAASPITDITPETNFESQPISEAASKNDFMAKADSSQEEIYLEMNRMNVWMEQVNESLNNKADLLSNEATATSARYQVGAENIMFFDRLSSVNRRPSWG